ncbi:MAG: hypothetical protein WAP03_30030 [Methylorubrum rhodinum]|uniref:hypothetical protein n=1 Tax=Methylorubrum rhodinum TaxID=29428 RepID=UPI003BB00C69
MAAGPDVEAVEAPPDDDYHEPEAINGAYAALSADAKLKLLSVETWMRGGTSFEQGELFREALTRAQKGKRNWRKGFVFEAFIIGTMRSVASHDRTRLKRAVSFDDVDEAEIEKGVSSGGSPRTPEEEVMSAQTVQAIHAHFEGDEQACSLLLGWGADFRGKDLRDFVGVDQAGLDYLIKRVRRTMARLYPKGFDA